MTSVHKETQKALEEATTRMKTQYNKKRHAAHKYSISDRAWLDAMNLHLPQPKKKLNDKHIGPFKILEKAGVSAYKLKLLPHWKIHLHFNEKFLTPYTPLVFPNQELPPPPPPDLIKDEEEYEIEEVLDSRTQ